VNFPLLAGCILVALLLLIGHWFPWQRWLGREMHRLESYVYGTTSIFLGFLLVRWLEGNLYTAWQLGTIIIAAGSATFGAWIADWAGLRLAVTRRKARRHEQYQDKL
jgi:hypothetical protein